ncbi:MAG TPA: DUF4437 domain-containing protein [Thermoanaerobaculia bacterium]|nr:DUF4437 domain-containing protein [Thermoanaerobaculia bacterium]
MKSRKILAFGLTFAAAAAILAQAAEKKMASKASGGAAVIVPAADLKWADLDPAGAPGVKSADVWGDHTKGAFRGFTKFPAGFATPLHTHTHAMHIAVISGTFLHTPEGKPEQRLGPGSYLFQPGAPYRHSTGCDKASECLFYIEGDGKFDLTPVEAARAPAKK